MFNICCKLDDFSCVGVVTGLIYGKALFKLFNVVTFLITVSE